MSGSRDAEDLDEVSRKILAAQPQSGTSIFDPVLVELAVRWFSPPGGAVLDPFAGGSVRGIVTAALGRRYTGVDLRAEQIAANEAQWAAIAPRLGGQQVAPDFTPELTPLEEHGGHLVKRDDLFCVGGVRGGKTRSCWHLAQGAKGLVTAGSRASPQVNIVAHVARKLGVPCRVHTPSGALSPEVQAAKDAGAEVVQHSPGYNSVIVARARDDAKARGWREIPFGMECREAVQQTRRQVANLPRDTKRLVMPVGSGMSLSGVLHGLRDHGLSIPVLGVRVGADPTERLNEYAPQGWQQMVTMVDAGVDYHEPAASVMLGDLRLDSHYEGKCLPFLEAGDVLWVVGIRQTEAPQVGLVAAANVQAPRWIVGDSQNIGTLAADVQADLVFSCPPYADLEVYSDDPRDLSTMAYADFVAAYRRIIAAACGRLKQDRFACFVVGDVRDQRGIYRNFVGDTITAFQAAGLAYYNEAILVTSVGSLPIRAGRQFDAGRKLGKTHQNVLVFVKGDPKRATEACGPVDMTEVDGMAADATVLT